MPEETIGTAVLEADAGSVSADSGEPEVIEGQESTESAETSQETTETEGQSQETGKTQAPAKLSLQQLLKTDKEKLKAINPALPNYLRDVMMREQTLLREFPGGIKEAVAAKNALSEYGGPEGLKEGAEALADYGRLEKLYENGDPQFIDRLAEAAPESFSKIMPSGLDRWRQADPEMYSHVLAKVMVNTLDGAQISDRLAAIYRGTEDRKVKDAVASIWQVLEDYRATAAKAPEPKTPDPKTKALEEREAQITQRERQAMLAPVRNAGQKQIQEVTEREMAQSYQWSETDPDVRQALREWVQAELLKIAGKDKTFTDEFERRKERGDARGLEQHIKNYQARKLPLIIPRIAKLFNVKPKAAPKVAPQTQKTGQTQVVDRGFQPTKSVPSPSLIDKAKTTAEMIMDGKYILKDGRKLQYQG